MIILLILLSFSFLAGIIMLLPAYFMTPGHFFMKMPVNQNFSEPSLVEQILNIPEEINSKLNIFQSSLVNISATEYLSEIINYLPGEVTLDSINFSQDKNYKESDGTLITISGVAINRDSLVSFSNLLKNSSTFSEVNMPVSSLAKEKNLPFTINIFIEKKQ